MIVAWAVARLQSPRDRASRPARFPSGTGAPSPDRPACLQLSGESGGGRHVRQMKGHRSSHIPCPKPIVAWVSQATRPSSRRLRVRHHPQHPWLKTHPAVTLDARQSTAASGAGCSYYVLKQSHQHSPPLRGAAAGPGGTKFPCALRGCLHGRVCVWRRGANLGSGCGSKSVATQCQTPRTSPHWNCTRATRNGFEMAARSQSAVSGSLSSPRHRGG